jgi:hypothetical protein
VDADGSEVSAAKALHRLIVVDLHHSVQDHQQRVTDRCLFHICPTRPAVVPELNRPIQPDESIAISGFTQSCLEVRSLQASTPQPTSMEATREASKTNRATQDEGGSRLSFTIGLTAHHPILHFPGFPCLVANGNIVMMCARRCKRG